MALFFLLLSQIEQLNRFGNRRMAYSIKIKELI